MITSGASASTPVEPQADERPWTAGPWTTRAVDHPCVEIVAGTWEIASAWRDDFYSKDGKEVREALPADANARLIAAAPCLAAAAELSLRSFGHAPEAVLVKTFGTDALRSIKALRAALSKAKTQGDDHDR